MSFMDKARKAAEQARQSAAQGIGAMTTPEAKAEMRDAASQVGGHVRRGAGQAKRGLVGALDKIDPGILADIIIKATALQESANRSLRKKGAIYRIGEITITASFPPQVGFTIERLGDAPEEGETADMVDSSELEAAVTHDDEHVASLEGSLLDIDAGDPSLDEEQDLLAPQDGR